MEIVQLDFEGSTKVETAVKRFKMFEPKEGYFLAFSGGKDSQVIYDIALYSGSKFDAHYQRVGVDPPELVYFIRDNYPDVIIDSPHYTMWQGIYDHGLPRRQGRWCCQKLKEQAGDGRVVVTGVRWAESARRKRTRQMIENCNQRKGKIYLNPIVDWTTKEVWDYIKSNNLPYCKLYDEGFKRLGCVLCPMTSAKQAQIEIERWPKLAASYRRASDRYFDKGTEGIEKFKSKDDFWNWWISRKAQPKETSQSMMFE